MEDHNLYEKLLVTKRKKENGPSGTDNQGSTIYYMHNVAPSIQIRYETFMRRKEREEKYFSASVDNNYSSALQKRNMATHLAKVHLLPELTGHVTMFVCPQLHFKHWIPFCLICVFSVRIFQLFSVAF
jgi:hypothetical protein